MALADFDEIRFPEKIALATTGGPEFFTTITATANGFEQRNANWEQARKRFRQEQPLKTQTELDDLLNFFYARRGMLVGFRVRDWTDFASDMPAMITNPLSDASANDLPAAGQMTPQGMQRGTVAVGATIGTGNSTETEWQLVKTYPATVGEDYIQQIRKPAGTTSANAAVRVFVNGVEQTEGALNDYTVDVTTGVVSFATPPGAVSVTADFLYDVPCRFNQDVASIVHEAFNVNEWIGIELVELRIAEVG